MPSRFQSFDDVADRAQGTARIPLLRAELARRGLDGFIVPRADEHGGEYVPPHAERLAWLTGFTGSAGTAAVLADAAALLVDGRYTLQAADQVDTALIAPVPLADISLERWVEANLPPGGRLGFDPWLHTSKVVERLRKAAERAGGTIVAVDGNPVDAIWTDRPEPPAAPVTIRPETLAGEATDAKLGRVRAALATDALDALLVSDPHNLAWLFNLRGGDVPHTPLALGYALVPAEGRPALFLDPAKVGPEAGRVLGGAAELHPPSSLGEALDRLGRDGARVRLDEATAASALGGRLTEAGGRAEPGQDPITGMKAVKNAAEIAGARAAHLRDGAAMVRFLRWLDERAPSGDVTEIGAAEALEDARRDTGCLREISFPTIAGSGPNGAIVHYRVTRGTDRTLRTGELFLVDSGAQYEDGTTDITRTVAVGDPDGEMRDRYTRVLRGHIAIATATFPRGTTGAQIDGFARRPLWEAGLDYDHGTGHGVGSYLSVHEGPQRISKLGHAALEPGMILSNEPGYYLPGRYGIRIENLLLVEPRTAEGGERPVLGFETLTLAPFDRRLIEPALMAADEIAWVDGYHSRVRDTLSRLLDAGTRDWLAAATRPIG